MATRLRFDMANMPFAEARLVLDCMEELQRAKDIKIVIRDYDPSGGIAIHNMIRYLRYERGIEAMQRLAEISESVEVRSEALGVVRRLERIKNFYNAKLEEMDSEIEDIFFNR